MPRKSELVRRTAHCPRCNCRDGVTQDGRYVPQHGATPSEPEPPELLAARWSPCLWCGGYRWMDEELVHLETTASPWKGTE